MKNFKYIVLSMLLVFMFAVPSFADPVANANATADSDVNVSIGGDDNRNLSAPPKRNPIPGSVAYGQLPGFFGDNSKPGHQFIALGKLLMYNTAWIIKNDYPRTWGQTLNITPHVEEVDNEYKSKVVICTKDVFDTEEVTVRLLAVGTLNATNKDVISSDLLDHALSEASKYGATHIQFLAEGTNTELDMTGWGIGFNRTELSGEGVSVGGTGYSRGYGGYQNLPWQQFFFLKVSDKNAQASISPVNKLAAEILENKLSSTADTAIKAGVVN